MAAKFTTSHTIKQITLEEMADFIESNYPEDKAWFKTVAFQDKSGKPTAKYNHLNAVREFCKKYAPELIPVAKEKKTPGSNRILNW